jgi:hypothetical protein
MAKPQTTASNKYHKDKYDRLYPFVPKGRKAEIQAAADRAGETLNEFIVRAIDERIEHMKPPHPRMQYQTDEAKAAIEKLKKTSPSD